MFVRHPALRVFLQPLHLVFGFVVFLACTRAAAQSDADSCIKCHADVTNGFAGTPHGKASAAYPNGLSCAVCHGDGKAHADSNGDTALIQNPGKLSNKEASARCLACHASQHPAYAQSAHATSGIACTSCHSVHAGREAKLLKASPPALCVQCHADVKASFSEPVRYNVGTGSVNCTSCHDPHNNPDSRLQASIAQQVSACLTCHTNLAGPWVYEHKAIRQAGCMSCHVPHGGKNPKLLIMAKVNTVCLECHLPSATRDDAQVSAAHTPNSTRLCTECHASIHGSNHDARFVNP